MKISQMTTNTALFLAGAGTLPITIESKGRQGTPVAEMTKTPEGVEVSFKGAKGLIPWSQIKIVQYEKNS